jgi:hypothetical protein
MRGKVRDLWSRPLIRGILAFVLVLGFIFMCCWGLSYWWFDVQAYTRLKPYPGAVRVNTERHSYSASGTPAITYLLIEQYEITGASLAQVIAHYKQTMSDDWRLADEGFDCRRCGDSRCGEPACGDTAPCSLYILNWYSTTANDNACVEIESLTDQDSGWRIGHRTSHGRVF